ncbi:MAG: hypothetical protein QHG98_07425 [Methanothrix sp.]|nr:hypothetical protein [Methanothrix sp.]
MPVKTCTSNGKPGFKWGDSGECYTYEPGSKSAQARAREKARKQGIAIMISQGKIKVK